MSSIADIRKDYQMQSLMEKDLSENPFLQFDKWWKDAIKSEIEELNAMTLATANAVGLPAARIVLLKEYNENGFVFFGNYESHKGRDLAENPRACLVFFWKELERQVRITGSVERISSAESDAYFHSRPAESRIGAWASPQSRTIDARTVIEENFIQFQNKFKDGVIPRPPHWGGYIVKPVCIEFWQGRPNRLHDRFRYTRQPDDTWLIERLSP